jgi:hypothetical protein
VRGRGQVRVVGTGAVRARVTQRTRRVRGVGLGVTRGGGGGGGRGGPGGGGGGGCGPVSGSRGWECRTVPWRVKVMAAVVVLRVGSSRRRGRPGGGLRTAARGWDGGGAAVGAVAEVVGVADLDGGVGRRGTGSRRRGRRVPHAVTRRRWRRGGRRPGRGRSRRSGRAARWRRRPAGGPLDRHGVTGGRWGGAGACHMHRTYIRRSDLSRSFRMLWISFTWRCRSGATPVWAHASAS